MSPASLVITGQTDVILSERRSRREESEPGEKEEEMANNDDDPPDVQEEEEEEFEENVEEGIRAARNRRSTRLPQYFTALVLSLTGFSFGTVMGWSAPGMEKVVLAHQPGSSVASWVSSSMPLGGFTATILTALTLNRYGRKKAMLGLMPAYITGWIIIAFGDHLAAYFTGRYLTGMCGGSYSMIVPVFIGEIAQKEIRGRICMLFQLTVPLGLLYIYSIGFNLSITTMSLLCTIPNILFFVLMFSIPESPRFLLSYGQEEKANKALQWFRGPAYHYVGPDIRRMKRYSVYTPYRRRSIAMIFSVRATRTALATAALLMIAQQLTGINVVINYSIYIFSSYIEINSVTASIIIACMMISGALLALLTIEKLGRRILLLISHSGLSICLYLLAMFYWAITDNEDTHWLAVAFTSSYVFIYALGAGPIPWVMLGELFPYQMKPLAVGFCAAISWIVSFTVAFTFRYLERFITIGGVYALYGTFCVANTIIIYFTVMETTGLSLEQIQTVFKRSKSFRELRRSTNQA